MDENEDYIRIPRLRAVRKVLGQLLLSRSARLIAMVRTRAVVAIAETLAERGRSGWVSTRGYVSGPSSAGPATRRR